MRAAFVAEDGETVFGDPLTVPVTKGAVSGPGFAASLVGLRWPIPYGQYFGPGSGETPQKAKENRYSKKQPVSTIDGHQTPRPCVANRLGNRLSITHARSSGVAGCDPLRLCANVPPMFPILRC